MLNECAVVRASKVNEARAVNSTLCQQSENLKTESEDLNRLVTKLKGRFFDMEVLRIKEKFSTMLERYREICRLAEARRTFMDEFLNDFWTPLKIVEQTIERLAAEAQSHPDQLQVIEERLALCAQDLDKLLPKLERMEESRNNAKMVIIGDQDDKTIQIDWRRLIEERRQSWSKLSTEVLSTRSVLAIYDELRLKLKDVETKMNATAPILDEIAKGKFGYQAIQAKEQAEAIRVRHSKCSWFL